MSVRKNRNQMVLGQNNFARLRHDWNRTWQWHQNRCRTGSNVTICPTASAFCIMAGRAIGHIIRAAIVAGIIIGHVLHNACLIAMLHRTVMPGSLHGKTGQDHA